MPRTFIAASTALMRRGPSTRTSARRAACARRARYGARRRCAARGELRAPDRGLRLGLAGEPRKSSARGVPARLRRRRGRDSAERCSSLQLSSGFDMTSGRWAFAGERTMRVATTRVSVIATPLAHATRRRCAPSRRASASPRRRAPSCSRRTCAGRLAPVITVDTCGFLRHHASDICASVQPRSRGDRRERAAPWRSSPASVRRSASHS